MNTELEEIVIISDREQRVKDLIKRLLSGEEHLSYSSLKAFKESPDAFIQYKLKERVQTPAMFFGTVLHCLVLEPNEFDQRYFVLDDTFIMMSLTDSGNPRATKLYKEWKSSEIEKAGSKLIVDPQIFLQAQAIATIIRTNRASKMILSRCPVHEFGIEWEYKNYKFRGFIDGKSKENAKGGAICDLKMVVDANPKKAQRTIIEMGYHIQAAMYLTGLKIKLPYYLICCDKKGGVSVHKITPELMEYGFKEYERLVNEMDRCLLSDLFESNYDFWSEYENGIFLVDKPAYLY